MPSQSAFFDRFGLRLKLRPIVVTPQVVHIYLLRIRNRHTERMVKGLACVLYYSYFLLSSFSFAKLVEESRITIRRKRERMCYKQNFLVAYVCES